MAVKRKTIHIYFGQAKIGTDNKFPIVLQIYRRDVLIGEYVREHVINMAVFSKYV